MKLWSAVATLFRGLFDFRFHPEIYFSLPPKIPSVIKTCCCCKTQNEGKIRQRERPRAMKKERERFRV